MKAETELRLLKAGLPYHEHRHPDGSSAFFCISPYCANVYDPEPRSAPNSTEDPDRYKLED